MAENSGWIVAKFGGTSVARAETYDTIVKHVIECIEKNGNKVCIVVSALSQVTNLLEECVEAENFEESFEQIKQKHVDLAEKIGMIGLLDGDMDRLFEQLHNLLHGIQMTGDSASPRLMAKVYSFGELLSSTFVKKILNMKLQKSSKTISCEWLDARSCVLSEAANGAQLSEEERFLNAYVPPNQDPSLVESKLSPNAKLFVTQGFIAGFKDTGKVNKLAPTTCVLGRGGGDTSGALFAALLEAKRLEIWTDVHGMFTADPREVPTARIINELSFREAQELAAMGAKVLHPRCLIPTGFCGIPVEIHNTMDPDSSTFTKILAPENLKDRKTTVMAISKKVGQVLVTVTTMEMWGSAGFLYKIFGPFHKHGISVDLVATSQYSVSLTLEYIPGGHDGDAFDEVLSELRGFSTVVVHTTCTVFSIIGRKLRTVLHLLSNAFKSVSQHEILLLTESSEDLNLSFVVNVRDAAENALIVRNLHAALLESDNGLPSPADKSASLFGKHFKQLMPQEMNPPVVTEKPKRRFFSIDEIPMDALNIAAPSTDLVDRTLITVESLFTDFAYFPLSVGCDIVLLKLVCKIKPDIQFIATNQSQIDFLVLSGIEVASTKPILILATESHTISSMMPTKSVTLAELWGYIEEKKVFHKRSIVTTATQIDHIAGRVVLGLEFDANGMDESLEDAKFSCNHVLGEGNAAFDVFSSNPTDYFNPPKKIFSGIKLSGVSRNSVITITQLSPFTTVQSYSNMTVELC